MKRTSVISNKLYSSEFITKYHLYHEHVELFKILVENLTSNVDDIYLSTFSNLSFFHPNKK